MVKARRAGTWYIVSVKPKHFIRVYPCPSVAQNQTSKADRTPKKTSDLATDGHGYTRTRSAGFLALDREKIGVLPPSPLSCGRVRPAPCTSSHPCRAEL